MTVPLAARIAESGVTPNRETPLCRAWRRTMPVFTPAYDIASQGLWYAAFGIPMTYTPVVYGGGMKRTDTRQSVAVVAPPGAGKDTLVNAVAGQLRDAIPELRVESLDVSHEEQLRGGKERVALKVRKQLSAASEPVEVNSVLWLDRYGVLGSDFAYLAEGIELATSRDYTTHRRYLRQALNPYGENLVSKRLTRESYDRSLAFCSPVVVALGFLPAELKATFTSSGLGRRFLALMASPGPSSLKRITDRGWLGPLDERRDMGVFDELDLETSKNAVKDGIQSVARTFWGRPFNPFLVNSMAPPERMVAEGYAEILSQLESGTYEDVMDEGMLLALRELIPAARRWAARRELVFTDEASRTALEVFNLVMDGIESRGGMAAQYEAHIRTTAQNLLARLAGITAGVAIAAGGRATMEVRPEDVFACALDFQAFMDMGLALVVGQEGEPFRKPLRDDVMWVLGYVRGQATINEEVRASEVRSAYEAVRIGHTPIWRTWDRVREELGDLGLVDKPPAGKGQEKAIRLTETGLAAAVGGGSGP